MAHLPTKTSFFCIVVWYRRRHNFGAVVPIMSVAQAPSHTKNCIYQILSLFKQHDLIINGGLYICLVKHASLLLSSRSSEYFSFELSVMHPVVLIFQEENCNILSP